MQPSVDTYTRRLMSQVASTRVLIYMYTAHKLTAIYSSGKKKKEQPALVNQQELQKPLKHTCQHARVEQ